MKKLRYLFVISVFAFGMNACAQEKYNNVEIVEGPAFNEKYRNIEPTSKELKAITLYGLERDWGKPKDGRNRSERINIVSGSFKRVTDGEYSWKYTYWVTTDDPERLMVYLYTYRYFKQIYEWEVHPGIESDLKAIVTKDKFLNNPNMLKWGWGSFSF